MRRGSRSNGMRLTCPSQRACRRAMYMSIDCRPIRIRCPSSWVEMWCVHVCVRVTRHMARRCRACMVRSRWYSGSVRGSSTSRSRRVRWTAWFSPRWTGKVPFLRYTCFGTFYATV